MALKPLCFHKPRGQATKAVKAVAEELLGRLATPAAATIGEAA